MSEKAKEKRRSDRDRVIELGSGRKKEATNAQMKDECTNIPKIFWQSRI